MILFFTNSLSISTDVPCAVVPFADVMESACSDCASHSLDMGAVAVGVGAEG